MGHDVEGYSRICQRLLCVCTWENFTFSPGRFASSFTYSQPPLVTHCSCFITGLPISQGNNTILTIVDRFSKAMHFVALPKLPTARETADLLVQHVFRLHGILLDIVSDRGPKFTSQV